MITSLPYAVYIRTFNPEWSAWDITMFGPFDSSSEAEGFIDTIPPYYLDNDRVEIGLSVLSTTWHRPEDKNWNNT